MARCSAHRSRTADLRFRSPRDNVSNQQAGGAASLADGFASCTPSLTSPRTTAPHAPSPAADRGHRAVRGVRRTRRLDCARTVSIAGAEAQGREEGRTPVDKGVVEDVRRLRVGENRGDCLDAPAAVSVITGDELEHNPGDQLVDHLRRVPGINVVQFSARDVNIASRSATGGINTSTLALVDGRNLYLDFLGFILWEFAPTDPSLIERVEVVRGPASSIWGANAPGGVVQVITKSAQGHARRPGSHRRRKLRERARIEARESFLAGPWALRLSAGYFESDAFPAPRRSRTSGGDGQSGPAGCCRTSVGTSGTKQPRFDLRADRDDAAGGSWMIEAGTGRTGGWIATGLGPFLVDTDTSMSYAIGALAAAG